MNSTIDLYVKSIIDLKTINSNFIYNQLFSGTVRINSISSKSI